MSNKEGQRVFGDEWKHLTQVELNAYFGLLFLAGVFRSAGKATEELWHATDGRMIIRAVMSRERFKDISRILRFETKTLDQQDDAMTDWLLFMMFLTCGLKRYQRVLYHLKVSPQTSS